MSHGPIMEDFRAELSARGLKFTRQRQAIAEVIFDTVRHFTLDDILHLARERQSSVGYATVYRTMKLLVECGFAEEHRFSDGQTRYERKDDAHHDHMICVRCGWILEFEDDAIEERQSELAHNLGFKVISHRHEIYVECISEDCDRQA